MDERRRYKREVLILYLHVFNTENGKVLGYLADVSVKGLMLVSEESIQVSKEIPLGIRLQGVKGDLYHVNTKEDHIACIAQSRWCHKLDFGLYGIGFMFVDIQSQSTQAIEELIKKIGKVEESIIYPFVETMIYLNNLTSLPQLQETSHYLAQIPYINAVTFEPASPHILIVKYSPQQIGVSTILKHLSSRGIQAELVQK